MEILITCSAGTVNRSIFLTCCLTGLLFGPAPASGQFTWDGSCGTDNWHSCCNVSNLVDNNWDLDPETQCPPFPGPKDDVDLNGATARISTRHVDIRNLFNGSLILQSFGLNVTGNVDLDALNLLGSDLVVGGAVNVVGPFTWRARLAGPQGSPATIAGPIMLDGILNATLDGLSLTANEPVSWTGSGGLNLNGGATFRNNASFSMTNNEAIAGNGGTFINNAPFSKNKATGLTRIGSEVFFDNTTGGSITIAAGTLSIEGSGRSSGAMSVSDLATIRFAQAGGKSFLVEENTMVAGAGRVQFGPASGPCSIAAGKTFTADNAEIITTPGVNGPGSFEFGTLAFERGTLGGSGVTTVSGPCFIFGNLPKTIADHTLNLRGATRWNGTNFVELQLFDGGVLNNLGQFTVAIEPNKRVRFINGRWINHPGSTLDILSNLQFIVGPGVFRNEGTLTVNPDLATVDVVAADFEQSGTLNLASGSLKVGSGRANAGRFNLSAGAILDLVTRVFVLESDTQFTGQGTVRIDRNGTLEVQAATVAIPNVELAGGIISGPGELTISDRLNWISGTMVGPDNGQTIISGELDVAAVVRIDERQVNARGETTLDVPATISLAQNARFVVGAGGVLTAQRQSGQQSNVFTGLDSSDVLVLNAGEIRIRGDGPDSFGNFASVPLDNRNLVDVQNVEVNAFSGGSSINGIFNIGADAAMSFGRGYQWNAGTRFTGPGLVTISVLGGVVVNSEIDAPNVELSGPLRGLGVLRVGTSLFLDSGTLSEQARLVNLSACNTSGFAVALTIDNAFFENLGQANLPRDFVLSNGGQVINRGSVLLTGEADVRGGATESVQNFREFNHDSPTSLIEVTFNNLGGTVHNIGGLLRFTRAYNQTAAGRLINTPAGTIVFDQPPALSRGTRIEGQGVFRVAGEFRSPANIAPGASAGRMTIEAAYIQEPDGVLEIEIGGRTPETEYDVLEIIGNAALVGTLDLRLIDGFQPQPGDRFTILTCTTRTGEFDALLVPAAPTAKGANWRVEYFADHVDLIFDG